MLNTLSNIGRSNYYWLALILFSLTSEILALVYQYALDYRPCVICIHVRMYLLGLILIPALAIWLGHSKKLLVLMHSMTTAISIALVERSYMLLGTERGWVFGSCGFDLGLPSWLAVEQWLPAFFKVWEPCGYTPVLLFNITMAEALIVLMSILTIISAVMTVAVAMDRSSQR